MLNLQNKIALITGASGGIGAACAKLLNQLGAHVIISGTNEDKLKELSKSLNPNHTIKTCDLKDTGACEELVNSIDKLDILVCNAGITKDNLIIKMTEADFDEVINVNLKAAFILNKAAARKMMRERYGRIINISSVVAFSGNAGQCNYTASKAGLVGMSKSLSLEVATRGITVNTVAPGFIETNMTAKLGEEIKEAILNKIPLKKMGTPEDIAASVAFLASNEASYITGQTIHVNGGMYM
ncbi:MAG: fabG [Rickettsiaceae bacterium]|jgi:3-oxoacyl-[acyl-carrier protein] reductase|nr:fabG [Rickettsiaceae bacterium]